MSYVREAVIHCIEIMGLKNPDKLLQDQHGGFIHINSRGIKRLFTPHTSNEYFQKYKLDAEFRKKKLHKVMTYYIVEDTLERKKGHKC